MGKHLNDCIRRPAYQAELHPAILLGDDRECHRRDEDISSGSGYGLEDLQGIAVRYSEHESEMTSHPDDGIDEILLHPWIARWLCRTGEYPVVMGSIPAEEGNERADVPECSSLDHRLYILCGEGRSDTMIEFPFRDIRDIHRDIIRLPVIFSICP